MVGIEKYWILVKLWHLRSFETLAAASLLNGNLLNASVEYVPVLRNNSSMNAYRPVLKIVKGVEICKRASLCSRQEYGASRDRPARTGINKLIHVQTFYFRQ